MCCATTEPCSPYCGLVIYEFQIIPLLHSSQITQNKNISYSRSQKWKCQFILSSDKSAQFTLRKGHYSGIDYGLKSVWVVLSS